MTWSANVFLLSWIAYLVCENRKLSHILYKILDVDNVNKKPPFFRGSLFLREEVLGKEKNFWCSLLVFLALYVRFFINLENKNFQKNWSKKTKALQFWMGSITAIVHHVMNMIHHTPRSFPFLTQFQSIKVKHFQKSLEKIRSLKKCSNKPSLNLNYFEIFFQLTSMRTNISGNKKTAS